MSNNVLQFNNKENEMILDTSTGGIISIAILCASVLIAIILSIIFGRKIEFGKDASGKLEVKISKENNNKESEDKLIVNKKTKKNKNTTLVEIEDDVINVSKEKLEIYDIKNHRFFSNTIHKYITNPCKFHLYEAMVSYGVKKESPEIIEFKKMIAAKYLKLCLFEYLKKSFELWVDEICSEVSSEKFDITQDKPPLSFYKIGKYITDYQDNTSSLARSLSFQFKYRSVQGIPEQFIQKFNDWSIKDIVIAQDMIDKVLYNSNLKWQDKIYEVLDMFELILKFISNDVDATLVLLNGELEHYVEELLKLS